MVSFICLIIKLTHATQRITQSQPSGPHACLCRAYQTSGPRLLGSGQRWPNKRRQKPQPCWGEATARPILWPWGLLPAQALMQGLDRVAEATMLWPGWGCPLLPADLCLSPSPGKGLGLPWCPPCPAPDGVLEWSLPAGPWLARDTPTTWKPQAHTAPWHVTVSKVHRCISRLQICPPSYM